MTEYMPRSNIALCHASIINRHDKNTQYSTPTCLFVVTKILNAYPFLHDLGSNGVLWNKV